MRKTGLIVFLFTLFNLHATAQCGSASFTAFVGYLPLTNLLVLQGQVIQFVGEPCTDPTATYSWNFGDGTASTGVCVTHSFSGVGGYPVSLTVSSSNNAFPVVTTAVFYSQQTRNTGCSATLIDLQLINPRPTYCIDEPVDFSFTGSSTGSGVDFFIDMGMCASYSIAPRTYPSDPPVNKTIRYSYPAAGTYFVSVFDNRDTYCSTSPIPITVVDCEAAEDITRPKCMTGFKPSPGDYLLSFWVKEELSSMSAVRTYSSGIKVTLTTSSAPISSYVYASNAFNSNNKIIDGWQKVEQRITIPTLATDISLSLENRTSPNVPVYFDDIRFHPVNSTFKSYVYDPVTMRLSAELDERNYATFYEYDEQGQLIRLKKETERGIKTIKESRNGTSK